MQMPFVQTPIKSKVFEFYLSGYNLAEVSFLVKGFSEGFRIPYSADRLPLPRDCKNHRSALANSAATSAKISSELRLGRIMGPFDIKPDHLICSPLSLIPKSQPGTFRLIHDLSYPHGKSINDSINKEFTEVHYDSIDTIVDKVKSCGRHCLMAKTDIEDAFRIIPIHQDDRFLLGFTWDQQGKKQFYMDCCLAMGLNISCQLFTRFSDALQWIMENIFNAVVSHIIDDFFLCGA